MMRFQLNISCTNYVTSIPSLMINEADRILIDVR